MAFFVWAKHTRLFHYIHSKKRSFLSLVVVTTLLSTSVIGSSIAVNNVATPIQLPTLCDPSAISQPVFVSPTPSQTPTLTQSPIPVASPSTSLSGDEEANGLVSQEFSADVIPKVVCPSPITNLIATPQNNQVLVSWTPGVSAELNVVENVSNFYLKILETNETIKVTSDKTSTLVSGLKNGVKYSFVVYASSEYGASTPSELISATPLSGNESEVAGLIIEFRDTTVIKTGDKDVPGEELVDQVDLTISNEITEDVRLVEFSEPTTLLVAQEIATEIAKDKDVVWAEPDRFVYTSAVDLVYPIFRGGQNKIVLDPLSSPTGSKVLNNNNSDTTKIADEKVGAAEIVKDKDVMQSEPDQFVNTSAVDVVNDPSFPTDQWNLWDKFGIGLGQSKTQMSTAWSGTAGQGITVAVIDTGITSHPDLDSQIVNGFDFVSNPEFLNATREQNGEQVSFDGDYVNSEKYGSLGWDDNPQDPGDWRGVSPVRNSTWHGTHIAGIIAAQNNNNQGIAGIAPGSKIQPIRALSWRGGLLSDIATSITWASGGEIAGIANNATPAKVINMSFSVNSVCPTSLQTAINDAFARGSVLVAAAGNNNDDVKNYAPANCENVITVGASNKDGKRAAYSNYGLGIDVSAPGGDTNDNGIFSTSNTGLTQPASFGYASQQGTSISAAHVTAIAARILSANPTFNPTEVKTQITNKESIRQFADTQCDTNTDIYCGEGIVSLFQIAAACSPTQTTTGGYTTLTFANATACDWSVPAGVTSVEALIVGGGGGGGGAHDWGMAGGGGAGYVYANSNLSVAGTIAVTVGSGGTGGVRSGAESVSPSGNPGGNSIFGSVTALGGSGGFGAYDPSTATGGTAATLSQSAKGGQDGGNSQDGLGGGGQSSTSSKSGGAGLANSITGSSVTYGTGGEGGTLRVSPRGFDSPAAQASGTGNGGTGAAAPPASTRTGGSGGSGVVIIRYATPNGSMSFAGNSSSYLTVPNSANFQFGTGDFTVEWWQKQTNTSSWPRVFEANINSSVEIGVSIEGQTFYWWREGSWACGTQVSGASNSTFYNNWHHFAVVRSSGTTKVYQNGSQLCTFVDGTNYDPTSVLTFGTQVSRSTGTYFGGQITSFHWVKGTPLYSSTFTSRTSAPTTVANSKLLLNAVSAATLVSDSTGLNTVTNNSSQVTWSNTTPFTSVAAPTIGNATISGTPGVGQTLTAAANTVTGSPTTSYQWQSAATSGGSYTNIASATSSTYVLTSSEATKFIKVVITVTNAGGSATATSSATTEVLATPTIASATITGNKVVGETLTATANTVTGTSPTITYEWQSSATSGGTYAAIPSATSSTYVLTSSEATKFIKVKITVTNAGGSANTTSTATTVIVSSCSATSTTPTINGVQMNVKQFLSTPTSCAWVAPSNVTGIEVLVVGGGAGGGSRHGGGGGAGGLVYGSSYSVTAGNTYAVVVGSGGTGSPGQYNISGTNGSNSSFGDSLIAIGGGGGGNNSGSNGGSGGGSQVTVAGGLTTQTSPAGATGYGNNGGSGLAGTCSTSGSANTGWCGGGGGGAGAVGGAGYRNSSSSFGAGSGGIGRAYSITGTSTYYAGGGGGGTGDGVSVTASTGGQGGGGAGGFQANGTNGLANTGGGGGGAGHNGGGNYTAGNGGSGIVVIAYASAPTVSAISPATGSVTSGGSVTITGTNFVSGQTTATINGVSLTSVSVSSSTTLNAVLPTLTLGTFDLVVNNGGGSATLSSAFTVVAAPTIGSATISGTPTVGQTLTAAANTVTGTSVTTSYQWQSATTSGGVYSNIGSNSSTYVLTSSEATKFIKVIITATNNGGNASTTSSATSVVTSACNVSSSTYLSNGITYNVRRFLTTGTCDWAVPSGVSKADVLVVGGGGAGGTRAGGGGGAGGYLYFPNQAVTENQITNITVGAGGVGVLADSANNGGDSRFGELTVAKGGGGGGGAVTFGNTARSGKAGGSGGGAAGNYAGNNSADIGLGTSGQGFNGGSSSFLVAWPGGGGGGSGTVGTTPVSNTAPAGKGGGGTLNSISGTSVCYATGGGAGTQVGYTAGAAGDCGGTASPNGGAGTVGSLTPATPTANTGAGGGGSGWSGGADLVGGNGGSGIVVVSYAIAPTVSAISPTNGAITGNVSVTITGANFITGSAVTIGGVSLTSVSVISGTSITGTISANSLTAGTKDVVVTTTSGASTGGTGLYEGVSKSTPTLASVSNISKTYGDSTFSISTPTATVSGSTIAGSVAYVSSDVSVASVSGSTATVVGVGTSTFTATFTPTNTSLYNSTTTTFTIAVATKSLTITADAKSKNFGASTPTNSYTLSASLVGSDSISSLTYTYSGTNTTTAPTAVGSYTITPSSVVFSTGSASNYSITYATGSYTIELAAPTIGSATISGTPGVNQTLTAAANTVTGTSVTTSYQWQSAATSGGSYTNIGTNSSTYVLTSSEAVKYIKVVVTVSNAGGSVTATSSATYVNTFTISYDSQGGSAISGASTTIGGSISASPGTPTRTNFTFNGWFAASTGGSAIGFSYLHGQTANFTLYAQWTQNSLAGISPSALTLIGTAIASNGSNQIFTSENGASRVSSTVPAGSLPVGTVVSFHLVDNFTRAQSVLTGVDDFILSMVVSWIALDGTVPDTAVGKGISLTIANDSIKIGAKIYGITNGEATLLGTATQNATVTVTLTSDPEVVIVPPDLDTPTVAASPTKGAVKSLDLSWAAIANRVTYTVKVYDSTGTTLLKTITGITDTSLTVTALNFATLAEKTAYRVSVTAIADGTTYSSSAESSKTLLSTGATSIDSLIGGSAFEAQSVSAVTTDLPSGSYAYQWFSGTDTTNLSAISGATSSNYTPSATDRSYTNQMYLALRVVATISGENYTFTSTAVPVYTYPNAIGGSVVTTGFAYTSGKYKVGQTVVAQPWEIMGTPWPTLNYQWWICDSNAHAKTIGASCVNANGAGNSGSSTRSGGTNDYDLGNFRFSYVVPAAAAGKFLTFSATLTNAATTAQGTTFTINQSRTMNSGVINSAPGITGTPNISGIASVGQRLTAATVTYSGTPTGEIAYQWMSSDTASGTYSPITNARFKTYTPVSADLGKYLQVIATATSNAGETTTATSATPTLINPAYSIPSGMLVSLDSPSSTKGATLSANITAPTSGYPTSFTYEYQWQRCLESGTGCWNIYLANSATYVTTATESTRYVRVAIRATNAAGSSAWIFSTNNAGPITR